MALLASQGQTVVVIGNDEHVCGVLGLADSVRTSAKVALGQLKALGIEHLQMLTGDAPSTANAIAKLLPLDAVSAGLLPADKVSEMKALVSRIGQVAMVGDGVNDAPALAIASVGIAMGIAGSDAAIETADVALMSNDLTRLPWLIEHSRRMLTIIKQNIGFSLGVKAIFVTLTFAGVSSLLGRDSCGYRRFATSHLQRTTTPSKSIRSGVTRDRFAVNSISSASD